MSKENWINEKCKEIEQQRKHAPQTMYRNIEEITGKRTFLSTGCLKAMNGDIRFDKEKILERWAEYIIELFKDDRKDHNVMKNNFAGPPIMKEEVETARSRKKMKHGKATGPDNISVELIETLEDFGIGKVKHLLNEIYDTGQIPTDLSKSIFIVLPKKPGATECELHRTISLMSHITKILLKIMMLRIRNKIKPEIAGEQCGFVEDKGTSNAIYILRTLIERALESQKEIYPCFIDYTKAFDREFIITFLTNKSKRFHAVRNFYYGPGSIIKEIKTKYVVEGFASFHIDAPSPGRLFFFKDRKSIGKSCAAETWCEDQFLWRPHPINHLTSISITIDTLMNEDMQDYFFFSLNNGIMYGYNLSISTSQYSMSLSKCAYFILFSEKYDLPWDSEYSRATANIFVLPPGRDISVKTCDMSVDGENLAYWTSESRESLWMGNSSSFLLATYNSFRLIITFDDQRSKMGVFYLFFSSPERRKPGNIYLREGLGGSIIKTPVTSLATDLHVSTNSFLFGLGFRCSLGEPCANGMEWQIFPGRFFTYFSYHRVVSLDERLLPPVGKDYLEFRINVDDRSGRKVCRLLHFTRGMDKHIVNSLMDVPESRHEMIYLIDVTWTENLADYLFIFPSLDDAGIKCEWRKLCIDHFVFTKRKTFDNSLVDRLDFYTPGTANLSNYAVFLTDKYQIDFMIYRFSSRPA
ncbi:RNA-directed DNA polymerase from mobile element jockey-like, partial [Plakobranchus ocellatus]